MATYLNIARPYANAVFAYAKERDLLDPFLAVLVEWTTLLQSPEIGRLLTNPRVPNEVLVSIFEGATKKGPQDPAIHRLLTLLALRRRLMIIGDLLTLYLELYREEKKEFPIFLRSAFPVSKAFVERLTGVMQKQYNAKVVVTVEIDPHLLGGAIISLHNDVIDGSIQGKLSRLSQALIS